MLKVHDCNRGFVCEEEDVEDARKRAAPEGALFPVKDRSVNTGAELPVMYSPPPPTAATLFTKLTRLRVGDDPEIRMPPPKVAFPPLTTMSLTTVPGPSPWSKVMKRPPKEVQSKIDNPEPAPCTMTSLPTVTPQFPGPEKVPSSAKTILPAWTVSRVNCSVPQGFLLKNNRNRNHFQSWLCRQLESTANKTHTHFQPILLQRTALLFTTAHVVYVHVREREHRHVGVIVKNKTCVEISSSTKWQPNTPFCSTARGIRPER